MKKFLIIFTILLTSILSVYFYSNKNSSKFASNIDSNLSSEIDKTQDDQSQVLEDQKFAKGLLDISDKNLQQQINNQMKLIAEKMDDLAIDHDEFLKAAAEMSEKEFLNFLPSELQEDFAKLHNLLKNAQDQELAKDGLDRDFFTKYEVIVPAIVKKRTNELDQVVLSPELKSEIQKIQKNQSIEDGDVLNLLKLCGRKNKDCIDKTFKELIDQNIYLSDEQFKLIQSYM